MSETSAPEHLTERQKKWFASVAASLERDTGKSLGEWVAIARTCSETTTGKRSEWLRANYGLGVNRAAHVLSEAFPTRGGWNDPGPLREALWVDPKSRAVFEAVERSVAALPELVTGQRKGFSAWSHKLQFAAMKPVKGGRAVLGLAVPLSADPRLVAPKNEGWSDRLKSKLPLASPADVDTAVATLLKAAWENS